MKSMSIVDHGKSRFNWVCRWTNGFESAFKAGIHILAGENVCIHMIKPIQFLVLFAFKASWYISSGVVITGFGTRLTGICRDSDRPLTIWREWAATSARVSSPYKC